jgi:hypothetical protein
MTSLRPLHGSDESKSQRIPDIEPDPGSFQCQLHDSNGRSFPPSAFPRGRAKTGAQIWPHLRGPIRGHQRGLGGKKNVGAGSQTCIQALWPAQYLRWLTHAGAWNSHIRCDSNTTNMHVFFRFVTRCALTQRVGWTPHTFTINCWLPIHPVRALVSPQTPAGQLGLRAVWLANLQYNTPLMYALQIYTCIKHKLRGPTRHTCHPWSPVYLFLAGVPMNVAAPNDDHTSRGTHLLLCPAIPRGHSDGLNQNGTNITTERIEPK